MSAIDYLSEQNIKFKITEHRNAYTALDLAVEEHVLSFKVAKPVIVKGDGVFFVCVLPACFKIDFNKLKDQLKVNQIGLASEQELSNLFPDCELGAEPPLGNLYGMTTLMDKSLEFDRNIIFQAGTHNKAVKISMKNFKKLVNPCVMSFIRDSDLDEFNSVIFDPYYYDTFVYNPFYPL